MAENCTGCGMTWYYIYGGVTILHQVRLARVKPNHVDYTTRAVTGRAAHAFGFEVHC